jgi:hypothetical protein
VTFKANIRINGADLNPFLCGEAIYTNTSDCLKNGGKVKEGHLRGCA